MRQGESAPQLELLGRERELAELSGLLDAVDGTGSKVLVLTGRPGAGKSSLVDWAAGEAAVRSIRTLRVRGSEAESDLCLAGAHQLLRPLLDAAAELPPRQADALRGAFGLGGPLDAAPSDPLLLGLGALTLISEAADREPLLLLVDDAQWLDVGTVDLLAFVARRLDGERAALLVSAREDEVPGRFDRDFPHLSAAPLERDAAVRLLDALPRPVRGRARAQVLELAEGNPLALIELSRAIGQGRTTAAAGTLPLTKRLEHLFAGDLPGLPAGTRHALLLAAASGTGRLADIMAAAPDLDPVTALHPAEQAGLVRVVDGQVTARHPLVLTAVLQEASFAERRAAHLALADAFADQPDRRAWQLSAAAPGPDQAVADALAEGAERSRERGGHAAAAAALERAAELSPDPRRRAERLLDAARSAVYAGHPQWVAELTGRIEDLTDDPQLRAEAALWRGWALGLTLEHDQALAVLLPAAEAMATAAPHQGLAALSTAATAAYNSGDPYYHREFDRILAPLDETANPVAAAWPHAALHPFTRRTAALARLERGRHLMDQEDVGALGGIGATAWILDETELAVRILGQAVDLLRRAGTAGNNATVAQALALARFESGAWTSARSSAEDAHWMATEAGADNAAVGSSLLLATLRALQGEQDAARVQAQQAVRGVDLRKSRSLHVRYRHALALCAAVAGDHELAYDQLRGVFTRDIEPAPVHYHASLHHLGDLAAAAVRADRTEDARSVLKAADTHLGAARSPRIAAIVHRATALLSDSEEAEEHFLAATGDPACARWPFELALAQLDFGEWLRRRRRVADARPVLGSALEIFQRLGARPWTERTAAELRAAGAAVDPPADSAAAELTPQERQIAGLAAQGLTNRDIAAQLYLSPRTVGYHLHKVFPKLGIRTRAQLRDALSGELSTAARGGPPAGR